MFEGYSKFNKKRIFLILFCLCVIYGVLTVAYILEYIKGNRGLGYVWICVLLLWLPYGAVWVCRVLGISERWQEWGLVMGYLLFYGFILCTAVTDYSWIYLFPLLCIAPMFFDNMLLVGVCYWSLLLFNLIEITARKSIYFGDAVSITKLEQRLLCTFLCFLFSYVCLVLVHNLVKLIDYLYSMNHIDEVTGLMNKEFAETVLRDRIVTNQRLVYSIIYMNIDNFRYFNDSFGNSYGDTVLMSVANKIRDNCDNMRAITSIVRFSGDIFFVMVGNRDFEDIEDIALRIKHSINSLILHKYRQEMFVNVSMVVTDTRFCVHDLNSLLAHCEEMLEEARETYGINQIVRDGFGENRILTSCKEE